MFASCRYFGSGSVSNKCVRKLCGFFDFAYCLFSTGGSQTLQGEYLAGRSPNRTEWLPDFRRHSFRWYLVPPLVMYTKVSGVAFGPQPMAATTNAAKINLFNESPLR